MVIDLSPGALWIGREAYCDTPEQLEKFLETLKFRGYTIQTHQESAPGQLGTLTEQEISEAAGYFTWARLENRFECLSCRALSGLPAYDDVCAECGVPFSYKESGVYRKNYRDVKWYSGKVYPVSGELPFLSWVPIYESWRWQPKPPWLPSEATLNRLVGVAGLALDTPYSASHVWPDGALRLANVRAFVDRYTTLNPKRWDVLSSVIPHTGPAIIRALTKLCNE
jgi:hypothetical protein